MSDYLERGMCMVQSSSRSRGARPERLHDFKNNNLVIAEYQASYIESIYTAGATSGSMPTAIFKGPAAFLTSSDGAPRARHVMHNWSTAVPQRAAAGAEWTRKAAAGEARRGAEAPTGAGEAGGGGSRTPEWPADGGGGRSVGESSQGRGRAEIESGGGADACTREQEPKGDCEVNTSILMNLFGPKVPRCWYIPDSMAPLVIRSEGTLEPLARHTFMPYAIPGTLPRHCAWVTARTCEVHVVRRQKVEGVAHRRSRSARRPQGAARGAGGARDDAGVRCRVGEGRRRAEVTEAQAAHRDRRRARAAREGSCRGRQRERMGRRQRRRRGYKGGKRPQRVRDDAAADHVISAAFGGPGRSGK